MSEVTLHGVSKSFGKVPVVRDLDLVVPDGAVVVILGESGSGKTTLLRMIAGFERPDEGTISIDGQVMDSADRYVPPERRRIGYVAQEGNLFPHLTVARNVAFGLTPGLALAWMPRLALSKGKTGLKKDYDRARVQARVEELLDLVGLGGMGGRYPHQLSGGQQQRVALARALAPDPGVMLLDEPFSSLDAGLRASLRQEVMAILRERNATTVFVTHDQQEALSVADLVGIMAQGRIRQFSTPENLYRHPDDMEVARFLGEANLIPGIASGIAVRTVFGELTLANESTAVHGEVTVLLRPEQITLRAGQSSEAQSEKPTKAATEEGVFDGRLGRGDGTGEVTGTVLHREYYGHDCVVLVDISSPAGSLPPIRVRCPGAPRVRVGDEVVLRARGDVVAWPVPAELDRSGR